MNLIIENTDEFHYSELEVANASRRVRWNINKRAVALTNNNLKQQNHENN
jgi:hypothetical protein